MAGRTATIAGLVYDMEDPAQVVAFTEALAVFEKCMVEAGIDWNEWLMENVSFGYMA